MDLFNKNVGLVYMIVNKMNYGEFEKEDLIQAGLMGLFYASLKYNKDTNNLFSSFAVPYIVGEIKKELRNNRLIKLNKRMFKIIKEISKCGNISIDDIAIINNVSKEIVLLAMIYKDKLISLNQVNDENDELIGIIKNKEEKKEDHSLNEIIKRLPLKEKKIIVMRYYKGYTQKKVGQLLGINQTKVSRIETKILEKIKYYKENALR